MSRLTRVVDLVRAVPEVVRAIRDFVRELRTPAEPRRVEDLHVGAITRDAIERERAAARDKWEAP